jgi:site-specific recombinase XerD
MIDKLAIYEKKRDEIFNDNEIHLIGFTEWLVNKGLSQKTIKTHVANVEFYIDDYLGCDLLDVTKGCHKIDRFLGDWFIRKASWSSCAHIKSYAASFKKFYTYLLEENVVEQTDFDYLCEAIKERMQDWLDKMKRYENMLFADYY